MIARFTRQYFGNIFFYQKMFTQDFGDTIIYVNIIPNKEKLVFFKDTFVNFGDTISEIS